MSRGVESPRGAAKYPPSGTLETNLTGKLSRRPGALVAVSRAAAAAAFAPARGRFGSFEERFKTPVSGMSDGILVLSLGLVSMERPLGKNEPLPFILDDLLINFDDIRSAETLKALEIAKKTQVLSFTHHQGLIDLAKKVIPGAK